ncbi:hypothetical protein J8281_09115 [Aquimarina sp. U1-2]|uniref:hypothetical protein n=1 Tax=Aquimarina sp. U1-2 TaxID=2823141 RepID=UPI001AECB7B4|nr:hypothetical protein [Aquimarina sp. U1-2]MBP2832343.1 hypothetical protein [Aquimarina sp. U1-2]
MKKLSIWLLLSCVTALFFTSCEGEIFESCPDMAFEIVKNDTVKTKTSKIDSLIEVSFKANFSGIENTPYEWFVNDSIVDSEIALDNRDHKYVGLFAPGSYEVCIRAETPDCPEGASFCETIIVEEPNSNCPDVNFTMEIEPGTSIGYGFLADFEGIENVTSFQWFINNQQIESPNDSQMGSKYLYEVLEPGETYNVCLKIFTPECIDGTSFCKQFVAGSEVECPITTFEVQAQENEGNYKFIAEIQREDVLYYWYINDTLVGDAGNAVFQYDFLQDNSGQVPGGPGEYKICLAIEAPNCTLEQSEKTCVTVLVENTTVSCPEPLFIIEPINETTKMFIPDFEINEGDTLQWFVNNQLQFEPMGAAWDDYTFTYQFEPGTYEICLKVEREGCNDEKIVCKNITIAGCPDISFNEEQDADSLSYFFYPNAFTDIDNTQIDWFVAGSFVGSSPENAHNNPFSYQFGKAGIYYVCMKIETPSCPSGVEYCKTIVVGEVCPPAPVFDYYPIPNSVDRYQFSVRELEWSFISGYRWYINGELLVTPNGNPFTDNLIEYQLTAGTYTICAVAMSDNCREGSEFCRTIQIE